MERQMPFEHFENVYKIWRMERDKLQLSTDRDLCIKDMYMTWSMRQSHPEIKDYLNKIISQMLVNEWIESNAKDASTQYFKYTITILYPTSYVFQPEAEKYFEVATNDRAAIYSVLKRIFEGSRKFVISHIDNIVEVCQRLHLIWETDKFSTPRELIDAIISRFYQPLYTGPVYKEISQRIEKEPLIEINEKIGKLETKVARLREKLHYTPGAQGFIAAKEHFESFCEQGQ